MFSEIYIFIKILLFNLYRLSSDLYVMFAFRMVTLHVHTSEILYLYA